MSSPIRVTWLPQDLVAPPGRLGLTRCPGSLGSVGSVRQDLESLQRQGTRVLVSLVTDEDLRVYGVPLLFPTAEGLGLEVWHLPIVDTQVPGNVREADELLSRLDAGLQEGICAVMHCIGGIGRTGTLAACLLVRRGLPPDEAIGQLRRLRHPRTVENKEQESYVHDYASRVAGPAG